MERIRQFVRSSRQQRLLHTIGSSLLLTPLVVTGNIVQFFRRQPRMPVTYQRKFDWDRFSRERMKKAKK